MNIKIEENYPLGPLTTLNVGGNARYFVEIKNDADIKEAINFAKDKNLPIFVLSGGSNVLISDEGFPGLVIQNKIVGIEEDKDDKMILTVGAGEVWDKLVEYSVKKGWAGIECLSGIPGSVGAAPVQNVGAYGEEVSSVIKEVVAYDTEDGDIKRFSKDDCKFSYRKSIFNSSHINRYIILEVVFEFQKDSGAKLNYKDLQDYFAGRSDKPSLREIRNAVIEIRSRKGMVIHPEYESFKSAGSFFKNPVVPVEVFEKVKEQIGESDGKWFWLVSAAPGQKPDGNVKISAAKLIERSGFGKGFKMGGAGISPKHSLSLINLGNAKAADIIKLAKAIITSVKERFDVEIEPEVLFVGFSENPL